MIEAVLSHAEHLGLPRDTPLKKTLFACDELSGFVHACGLVRPTGLDGLEPKSVKKKLKQPSFAAGVHRDEVYAGAELLGLELDEHIRNVVAALQPIGPELGLRTAADAAGLAPPRPARGRRAGGRRARARRAASVGMSPRRRAPAPGRSTPGSARSTFRRSRGRVGALRKMLKSPATTTTASAAPSSAHGDHARELDVRAAVLVRAVEIHDDRAAARREARARRAGPRAAHAP